ncbi:hypothetical protein MVEG_08777 [Podila verticillata NRRL 6337]|nr:MAG: hypothetical protein BYD32DRAFT_455534 [Podila humilis]KFH65297.1 hypothetical protein MVEG_08777 [Podila verticillata NRRL 6337]
MSSPSNGKVQQRRAFLAQYENGSKSYFKKEGAVLMALITILIVGVGAFALSSVSLNVGYFFLLLFIALVLAFIGTYLTYHYKLTQAHKTMAFVHDTASFHHAFDQTYLDRSWNDASIYAPPPAIPISGSPTFASVPVLAAPAQAVIRA